MSHPCQRSNPLVRGGTDQQARHLPALATDHFLVDERTLADFILFARRYARNIRYYGEGAASNTSWEAFFAQDISVNLATLASVPLQRFIDFKDSLRAFLEQGDTLDATTRNAYFRLLLHLPLMLLFEIGEAAGRLPRNETLIRQLEKWAGRELGADLLLLKCYVLGAGTAPLQDFSDQPLEASQLHTDAELPSALLLVPETVLQRVTPLNWSALADAIFAAFPAALDNSELAAVTADPTPYQQAAGHHEQVFDALNYNLLIGAIEKLLSSIQAVITLAGAALEAALQRNDHTPHYGLWLAFLHLYQHPQRLLNQFTGRHLDFYYRDVLQLNPLPPTPDQVALVLELARHKQEHLLPKGTRFNAGKDSAQVPRHYALARDTVINKGQISELKSFFVRKQGNLSYPYAAQVTNSADGLGAKLDKTDPQWPPFGPAHVSNMAEPGFALADPTLRLSDGTREVTVTITFATALPAVIQQVFAAALSTEDGWLLLTDSQLQVSGSGNVLTFRISLDSDQPAITPYASTVHGFNFAADDPVLRLWLKPASGRFMDWIDARVSQTRLAVAVTGTRHFSLASDLGTLDATKPCMPYGAVPRENSYFVLGGRELFSKPLASLTLHPQWQESFGFDSHFSRDANPFASRVRVEYLKGGRWQPTSEPLLPLFAHAADLPSWQALLAFLAVAVLYGVPLAQLFFNQDSYLGQLGLAINGKGLSLAGLDTQRTFASLDERYQSNSVAGFVRFTLQTPFGQGQYPQENALSLLAGASDSDELGYAKKGNINYDGVPPKQPYTPVLSALSLDYVTTEDSPGQMFHVFPFGSRAVSGVNPPLLPPLRNAGELYLGLSAMDPPQSVSLLFAAVAGSANPLKPPATLQWHYLAGDDWVEIPATAISDTTSALTGSGIIAFALPAQANTQHAILPEGKHWLRLSVASDTDALCNLLGIHTQGALAVMVDNGNTVDVLETPLSAGAISKLLVPDTAIKGVTQPLPSFGGKPAEQDRDFNMRVSERLRHKNRAVTIWDYEHLVLQAFPQVFKVRCLNHTALCRDGTQTVVAENGLHPGAVLVVPVPRLQPGSAADPHRPYNTTRTLADIDAFLRRRISPFVHLEVQNPRIEEIRLSFRVALTDDIIDVGFYLALLNQELNQYLMPWAYVGMGQADFGGRWYKSVLINFIEERPYVNYIKDVLMFHRTDIQGTGTQWQLNDREEIRASTARSILVSHPQHVISSIDEVPV